jgi:hypothetical protein
MSSNNGRKPKDAPEPPPLPDPPAAAWAVEDDHLAAALLEQRRILLLGGAVPLEEVVREANDRLRRLLHPVPEPREGPAFAPRRVKART